MGYIEARAVQVAKRGSHVRRIREGAKTQQDTEYAQRQD